MYRDDIVWTMPFVIGLRIQNAYIARNTAEEGKEKPNGCSIEKFLKKKDEIIKKFMPEEYFNGDWGNAGI